MILAQAVSANNSAAYRSPKKNKRGGQDLELKKIDSSEIKN